MKSIQQMSLALILSTIFSLSIHAPQIDQGPMLPSTQQEDELTIETESDVDINRKSDESKQLVLNAVKHFMKEPVAVAINDFVHNTIWRKGELFVFVFKDSGTCLAHGDDYDMIWQNIKGIKGVGGSPLINDMLRVGKEGGRLSYLWNNGYQTAYVKTIMKDGQKYILGSGFYPENDEFSTKQIVKTAVAYFYANGRDATFALISNTSGPFVKGDIYSFAYDFNGTVVAHGQNEALVGQDLIDLVDSRGKPLIRELIEVAKTKGKGWVEYYWRNEFKRSYVEKVVDPKTKTEYLISAGYYPNITLNTLKTYVHRGIHYLKANGSKRAFSEFSNVVGEFAQGSLNLFVLDLEGKVLANGENPAYVGQNLLKMKSSDGRYFIKDIINLAKKNGSALVTYVSRNANTIAYVEFVETPDGKFIIGAEFFPESKMSSAQTLVNRAVDLMKSSDVDAAFGTFSEHGTDFVRGDLSIFVYDGEGTRLVNGTQKSQIWQSFLKATDQQGKMIVSDLITVAVNGGGWVEYQTRNARRKVYVKSVPKKIDGGKYKNYIVGSGYFL